MNPTATPMPRRSATATINATTKVSHLYRFMRGPYKRLAYGRLRMLQADAHMNRMLHLAVYFASPIDWAVETGDEPAEEGILTPEDVSSPVDWAALLVDLFDGTV